MTLTAFNRFCKSLPHTFHVVQWGGVHVWKVGGSSGKMFALGFEQGSGQIYYTFKVSALAFDILKEQTGLRPAPYLASRGMTWIQRMTRESMDDPGLRAYLKESHRLCALALPKKQLAALGLAEPVGKAGAKHG